MKFCIEVDILGNVTFDFARALIDSIGYQRWSDKDCTISYELYKSKGNYDIPSYSEQKMKELIPVGSVEFVTTWLKEVYDIIYVPIQIPFELCKKNFLNRNVGYGQYPFTGIKSTLTYPLFVKNVSQLKTYTGIIHNENEFQATKEWGITNDVSFAEIPPKQNDIFFFSEYVDFESEYRVFVYKNEIVAMKHYSGDFWLYPDNEIIKEMVKTYSNFAPIAYTLDVGIHKLDTYDYEWIPDDKDKKELMPIGRSIKNVTSLIEVHDFFSCGLYGFNEEKKLPFMFARWWNEYINKK